MPKAKEISIRDVMQQLQALLDHFGADTRVLASHPLTGRPLAGRRLGQPLARQPPHRRAAKLSSMRSSMRRYPHVAALGELLTAWHQDPNLLDRCGRPLPLEMRGARRSFTRLAKKSVPRADPRRLLAELERVGAVVTDSSGLIRVKMRSLPVYGDPRFALQHTLLSLHSFMKTLHHNLQSAPSNANQLFHRVAVNGAFDLRHLPALKIRVKRRAQSFLELMDNWMVRRQARGKRNARTAKSQVAIGVYLSVEPVR
jgi:Family of unknown function (DUF6502)